MSDWDCVNVEKARKSGKGRSHQRNPNNLGDESRADISEAHAKSARNGGGDRVPCVGFRSDQMSKLLSLCNIKMGY